MGEFWRRKEKKTEYSILQRWQDKSDKLKMLNYFNNNENANPVPKDPKNIAKFIGSNVFDGTWTQSSLHITRDAIVIWNFQVFVRSEWYARKMRGTISISGKSKEDVLVSVLYTIRINLEFELVCQKEKKELANFSILHFSRA